MLAWAFGQASIGSTSAGVALWIRTLYPMLSATNPAPNTVDLCLRFIELVLPAPTPQAEADLLKRAACVGGSEALLPVSTYMSILRMAYENEVRVLAAPISPLCELVYVNLSLGACRPGGSPHCSLLTVRLWALLLWFDRGWWQRGYSR